VVVDLFVTKEIDVRLNRRMVGASERIMVLILLVSPICTQITEIVSPIWG